MPINEPTVVNSFVETAPVLPRAAGPNGWEDVARQLADAAALQPDWDGEGAKVPPPELIESVSALIEWLKGNGVRAPWDLSAGIDGDVILTWRANQTTFEIVAEAPGQVAWMFHTPGHPSRHGKQTDEQLLAALTEVAPRR